MLAFRQFYGRYNDLMYIYKLSLSHMLFDIFHTKSETVLCTLTLTADNSAFMVMELGPRRVCPIDRGCLLLLDTWHHLWYVRGSGLAHLFLWLVIRTCLSGLTSLWNLSHFIFFPQIIMRKKCSHGMVCNNCYISLPLAGRYVNEWQK
jgi:hypothetical protein